MKTKASVLQIEIVMDNAAFGNDPGHEVARILRVLAKRCEDSPGDAADWTAALRDINGNKVGSVAV